MARYFFLLFLMAWMTTSMQAQQANNVSLLGNWDDNSLVTISGVQYNDIWGYAADGKEFAIIGSQQKVHFIDVTNPNQIVEIAAIAGGNNAIWRDMKTYGTYAYSVADQGSEGLLVFDLSNITNNTNPSVTLVDQQNSVFSRAHNIYIDTDHGFLYVAGSNAGGNADLLIYDLNTTPGSPSLLQSVNLPGNYIHDVYVKDHIAYCSHEGRGLYIYNLCGITNPSCTDGATGTWVELGRIDTYQFQGYNHSSWVQGNTIVFADETHGSPLTSADISDLGEIEILDYFQSNQLGVANPTSPAGSVPHNPFILGDLLVASYYHDGVVFYDLTDPANVQKVGYYDTYTNHSNYSGYDGCWGTYPFLPSGRIIASDVLNGLFVLEMSAQLQSLANGGGNPCDVGSTCDDGNASTYDDVLDANCVCTGTPCPIMGTTCNDGDASTFNDQEDGNCNCIGTPCPAIGTTCDDGNPNTENDVADGNCGCAGMPIGDCTYVTINSSDFEAGFGIWNDGGADCILSTAPVAAYSGTNSVVLRDNTSSSVMTTNNLDLSAYEEITVDFAFIGRSMEIGEDFWLQVSTDAGATFTTVASWVRGTDFNNGRNHYFESVVINGSFTSTTSLRFRCDATANNDIVYIDDVVISGCTNGGLKEEENTEMITMGANTEMEIQAENETAKLLISSFNDLKLAPNPTRDQLNVSFTSAVTSEMQLFVTNVAGQRILSQTIQAEAGNFGMELNTSNYVPGIYFLTIMTADQQISQKFVVVE